MQNLSRRSVVALGVFVAVLVLTVLAHRSRAFNPDARAGSRAHPALGTELLAVRRAAREGAAELLGRGGYPVLSLDRRTALWGGHTPPNWWQSALALDGLLRYGERDPAAASWLQPLLTSVYDQNVFRPHSRARRDFANEFMDDTGWWGQTWAEAADYESRHRHDLRDARRFLAVAEHDAHYIARHPRPCGGIEWELGTGTDTVTNTEFVTLTAELARLRERPGPLHDGRRATRWRSDALGTLRWLERSGLINTRAGTVHDRFGNRCRGYVGRPMTYTEGETAEALLNLAQATGRRSYLRQAGRFLRYAVSPAAGLLDHGVLREHCEATAAQCADLANRGDMPAYKGILVEALSDWDLATHRHTYASFLRQQAQAILRDSVRGPHASPGACLTPDTCRFTFSWLPARPWPRALRHDALEVSVPSEVSALDALSAVLPVPAGTHLAGF